MQESTHVKDSLVTFTRQRILWAFFGWSFLDPDCNQINCFYFVAVLHFYLQLFLIKGFEQMLRNNLIKAFLQGQKLSLDAMQETPVDI